MWCSRMAILNDERFIFERVEMAAKVSNQRCLSKSAVERRQSYKPGPDEEEKNELN